MPVHVAWFLARPTVCCTRVGPSQDAETDFDGLYSEPVNMAPAGAAVSPAARAAMAELGPALRKHFDVDSK